MTRLNVKLWGIGDADDAEAVAGELVANAVEATGKAVAAGHLSADPVIVFRLSLLPGRLRIEVWDRSPSPPRMADPDWESESGRGLFIVDSLTAGRWGHFTAPAGHDKCVWAEIIPSPPASGR